MDERYKDNQFCITVEYDTNESKPEQIFLGIAKLIESLQYADAMLVGCIAKDIEPVVMLDDIEQGSIKVFLRTALAAIPDEGLERCDIKRVIGTFLVKGKYALLRLMGAGNIPIREKELQAVEDEIVMYAKETGVSTLGCYTEVNRETMITSMAKISEAVNIMRETDRVSFGADINGHIQRQHIPRQFDVDDHITDSLVKDKIINRQTVILKIQKVDFVGNSKWEFRLGHTKIATHIEDEEWLTNYRAGKIILLPGDSLKVELEETMQYGKQYDLLCSILRITKVIEVIHMSQHTSHSLL